MNLENSGKMVVAVAAAFLDLSKSLKALKREQQDSKIRNPLIVFIRKLRGKISPASPKYKQCGQPTKRDKNLFIISICYRKSRGIQQPMT